MATPCACKWRTTSSGGAAVFLAASHPPEMTRARRTMDDRQPDAGLSSTKARRRHRSILNLSSGSRQWNIASRQCSSSCSTSVMQWGRNRAMASILRHVGCARSLSLIVANIGIFRLRSPPTSQCAPSAAVPGFWRNNAPERSQKIVRVNSGDDRATGLNCGGFKACRGERSDHPRQRLATSSRTGVSTSGGAFRI
jgi:hypothetical protein